VTDFQSVLAWRLQGEVVPASQKDPEGWGPADKFTLVLETAGSSFGHVQRNLLSGEGSRHDPVPCAWQPVSADHSGAVKLFGAPLNQIVVGHAVRTDNGSTRSNTDKRCRQSRQKILTALLVAQAEFSRQN
jgi:hypothetical protein